MSEGSFWGSIVISVLAGTALAVATGHLAAGGALTLALLAILMIVDGAAERIVRELKR